MTTQIVGATGIDKVQDGTIVNADIDTVAASKLTGALPAISAANLTAIPAANITGTLPAISGANLTSLPSATADGFFASSGLSAKDLGQGLHIKTGDSGIASGNVNSNFSQLIIEGSAQSGMAIISGASHEGVLAFSDSGGHRGLVRYVHSTDKLSFATTDVDRVFIDSNGVVSKPYQPSFWASGTSSSGYNTMSSNAEFVFSNAQHNTGSHYNTSNGRFTAPVAGAYLFSGTVYGNKNTGYRWTIKKNNSQFASGGGSSDCVPHGFNNDVNASTNTIILNLAANDYVSCSVRSGQECNLYGGHSYFSGVLVG
jgi:hypothetical protein